jgi:hypothetical protein
MIARYAGRWHLVRSITDESAVTPCRGEATLRPQDDWLRYDEAVTYRLGDRTVRATRAYYYRREGEMLVATFDDRRPFFRVRIVGDGTAVATHPCGDDLYRGTFTFTPDGWRTQWDVSGTKALRITTEYLRPASVERHADASESDFNHRAVRFGPAVAIELPRVPDLGDHAAVHLADHDLIAVAAGAGNELSARVDQV